MPLPLDLLEAEAARMEREVAKLVAAGDLDRARRLAEEAVAVRAFVEARRKTEGSSEGSARLTRGKESGKVKSVTPQQRQAISQKMLTDEPEWMEYARRAGMPSLGAIAGALKVSTAFMSLVASGKKHMSDAKAKKFEKLTGYPASKLRPQH